MTDSPPRRSGLLTPTDEEWLDGTADGHDQKYRLKIGIANTMADIKTLLEVDPEAVTDPSLDGVSDLFEHVETDTDMSLQECAQHLITLAFLITNEPIDYEEVAESWSLHPRDDDEMPRDEDRPVKQGFLDFNQEVDDLLAFRRALRRGVKVGKERVENDTNDVEVPDIVTFAANTALFKEPTVDRLDPGVEISTEMWRDAFAQEVDAYNLVVAAGGDEEFDDDPDEYVIDRSKALSSFELAIKLTVANQIASRHNLSEHDIPAEYLPGVFSGEKGSIELTDDLQDALQQYREDQIGDPALSDQDTIKHLLDTVRGLTDLDEVDVVALSDFESAGDTQADIMSKVVTYLINEHNLLQRISLPYVPTGENALINDEPHHPDGSEMKQARELPGGVYLGTQYDKPTKEARLQSLANECTVGLIFDW